MLKRVLIVDDEAATLIAYKKLLQRPGIEINTAETLEDAAHWLKIQSYQIVISDLRLTGTSGLEGLAILRFVKAFNSETKVILITAYGNPELREQAINMGASCYLEKPVLVEDLRTAIDS